MRALLFTVDYPPNKGGVSRFYYELVKIANGQIGVAGLDHGKARPIGNSFFIRLKQMYWAYRSCLSVGNEVKILAGQPHLALGAILSRKNFSIIIHGGEWGKLYILYKLLTVVYSMSSQIIVNSNATKLRWIPKKFHHKCIILTPGLSRIFLSAQSTSNPKEFSNQKIKLLCVSRLTPRKNIDKLVIAVKSLKKNKNIDISLDIVGNGKQYANLLSIVDNASFINLHRQISDEDLLFHYSEANIFILTPSEIRGDESWEGFGIVFLEAASLGLPIICSNSGGVIEATIPEGRVLISSSPTSDEIQNAILNLANNSKKMKEMSQKNIDWSKTNSWETKLEIIESMIS